MTDNSLILERLPTRSEKDVLTCGRAVYEGVVISPSGIFADSEDAFSMAIEDLQLTIRTKNALIRAGYKVLGDIIKSNTDKLSQIKHLGMNSLSDIESMLQGLGVSIVYDENDVGTFVPNEVLKRSIDLSSPLRACGFSNSTYTLLEAAGYTVLGDILSLDSTQLAEILGLGTLDFLSAIERISCWSSLGASK